MRPSKPQAPRQGKKALLEYLGHFGKWLIFSQDSVIFEELAIKIDPYVESGDIDSAKYNRKPGLPGSDSVVMCVYCDDREREKVWEILRTLGVTKRIWKYDRQTYEDWAPSGRLYKTVMGSKKK